MRPTAEEKKARYLQTLRDERLALLEVAAAVPPAAAGVVFLGEWSAKDIVAHLIGWDYANIEAIQAILGSNPDEALPVLAQSGDKVLRKAQFVGDAFELDVLGKNKEVNLSKKQR